jgi:predicted Zn-dependent peptidase
VVLGVRAYNLFDERRFPLQVIADILGGGMSSRLFQRIREELGAAYYVRSGADLYLDHGYLEASAGVDHRKAHEVIRAILHEFKRLTAESVSEEELKRVKDHLSGGIVLGLETSDALAGFYGGQEITTKTILTPEEIIGKIQAVTANQIMEVANDIFKNEKLNLALIGPFEKEDEFKPILTF